MKKLPSIAVLAVCLAVCGVFTAGPALAHAHLRHAQPAAGATVKVSPKAITLDFSEGVVARFSGIALSDAAGKPVATGTAANGAGAATLVVPLAAALPPGAYKVTWHAVAADSHRTQGSFGFTVAP